MTDYNYTISLANSLEQRANDLKAKSNSMTQLTSIVGNTYVGTDAEAYRKAVTQIQEELNSIANELYSLARRVRAAAISVRDEEAISTSLRS